LYHADLLGGLAARLVRIRRVIWSIRNTNLDAGSISTATRAVAWLAARVSRLIPERIVYNSLRSRAVHAQFGYSVRRCQVIQNGYDLEIFRPDPASGAALRAELGVRTDEYLVGCVARWDPQKDHANLVAALGAVARGQPRLRILLVGTGMDPANERLALLLRAADLGTRVILAGPRDDIPTVMNALDLHVLSSSGEAFPNVVAEAMACGTACVVTDVGDAALIVGDTGWMVPPHDSQALASAIEAALGSLQQQSRAILGARCRARVVEHFGLQKMTDSYCTLWRELATLRD
jgi:glycosyltransferase involved in cell wall biosynthesis